MNIRTLLLISGLLSAPMTSLVAAKMHAPIQKASHLPEGPKIRVLLAKDVPSALVELKGKFRVIRKDTGDILSYGSSKRFVLHALQHGLRWGEEYPDVYQISIVPQTADTLLYVNGIQYKGALSIYHVRDNRITVVNEVAIEDFIKSTLALNFDSHLSKEAMAALAITARTEAYARCLSGKESLKPWDLKDEEAGYYGFGVTCQKNGVDDAVEATRFMVMESTKQEGPALNLRLQPTHADELAKQGYDAQKILKSSFPNTRMGVTVNPNELARR